MRAGGQLLEFEIKEGLRIFDGDQARRIVVADEKHPTTVAVSKPLPAEGELEITEYRSPKIVKLQLPERQPAPDFSRLRSLGGS